MYPYPATDGGKIVTYNTLKYLNELGIKNIILTFCSMEKIINSELNKIAKVYYVKKNTNNRILDAMLNIFSLVPYNMYKYIDNDIYRKIDYIMLNNKIDIVYVDHLHMAIYSKYIRKKYPNIKIILRQHNVETVIMERFYKEQKNKVIKAYSYIQFLKLRRYESKIAEYFNLILTLTDEDRYRLLKMTSNNNIKTIPAGVDKNLYCSSTLQSNNSIVFLGTMNWLPNEDGICWFVDSVFNKIENKNKDVKLYIVGKNPTRKVQNLRRKNIIVTGFVEDDREYIDKAAIFIVPLRIGGGMRIKILNAMSMKKCIVSTSVGAEGIDVVKNEEIIIEDDPNKIADKILECLRDIPYRKLIGENARKKIIKKYSWEVVVKSIYLELKKLDSHY